VVADVLECEAAIVERSRIDSVLGKTVADGDDRDATLETESEKLSVNAQLITVHKAAAVDIEQERMRPRTRSPIEIHDIAFVRPVSDVGRVGSKFV
jgi:hypothetical protein